MTSDWGDDFDLSENNVVDSKFTEITIDIETLPGSKIPSEEELIQYVPKNISKPETINKWIQENGESIYRKQALDSMVGQILCIGIKINNNDTVCEILDDNFKNELDLLKWLYDYIIKNNKSYLSPIWVGHNVTRFDLAWIWRRAIKYQLFDLAKLIPRDRYSKNIIDTANLWSFDYKEYHSLDSIAKFLGYEGKPDGIDGSKVYDYYIDGKLDDIKKYCKWDVDLTYAIYKHISNGLC